MKIPLLLMALCFSFGLYAATGHELFAQEKWDDALHAYEQEQGSDATTLFRMGQCALRVGKIPDAMWYLLRAQRSAAFSSYILIARMISSLQFQVGVMSAEYSFLNLLHDLCASVPLLWWQLLLLLGWMLLLLYGKALVIARRWGRGIILGVFLCGITGATVISYRARTQKIAVIMEKTALRTGPSEKHTQLSLLVPGTPVQIIATARYLDQFLGYKVLAGSRCGWISSCSVKLLSQ